MRLLLSNVPLIGSALRFGQSPFAPLHYLLLLSASVLPLQAGTLTYDGGGTPSSALDVAANWVGDTLPTTNDEVLFNNSVIPSGGYASGLSLDTSTTWGNFIWNTSQTGVSIGTTAGLTFTRSLTLSGAGGSTAAISAGGASGDIILLGSAITSGNITLGGRLGGTTGTLTVTLPNTTGNYNINVVNAGATVSLGQLGGLTAANTTLTKTGAGTVTFGNGNTSIFTGANTGRRFIHDQGTVNFGANTNFNAATFEIRGGTTLNATAASTLTVAAQEWAGDFTFTGTQNLGITSSGGVTLSGSGSARQVTVNASSLTINGAIGGSGYGLTKAGAGTLTLTGSNTYDGPTTILGGSLVLLGGSDRLATGSEVIIANGTSAGTSGILNLGGQNQTIAKLSSTSSASATKGSVRNTTTGTTATLTVTGTSTFDGVIRDNSGTGTGRVALTKSTGGTLTLTGVNTYTGSTMITGGSLIVNGSLAAGSAVSLGSGTLGGSGTIGGLVTTAGTSSVLSPGNSPGTLTLSGGLNADAGANFVFELGTASDLLNLGSGVFTGSSAANGLVFDLYNSGGLTAGTAYTLLTFGSSTGLDATDLFADTLPSGFALDTSFGTNGFQINSGSLQIQFVAVPEPSPGLLLALGLIGAWVRRQRSKKLL